MKSWNIALAVGLPLTRAPIPALAQQGPQIVTEEAMVASGETGIEIYARNKHPAELTGYAPGRTLVFVHGATYPASTSFDLQLGGVSFMDDLARKGFDVYLMDLPGYGRSSRPPQMGQPAEASPPFETTEDAVRHYGSVVDYVLKRRGIPKVNVMGWSWGTTIAAGFAVTQPEKVERLVLYAPVWIVQGEVAALGSDAKLGAFRAVTSDSAKQRWLTGVATDKQASLIPEGWFDVWQRATWATDPAGAAQNPPVVRAPNGAVQDLRAFGMSGKPTYDPARITAPTLLVHGEWDRDTPRYMAQTLFPLI
jgi:pimeloyl-ACP methyl ester carboxylesterase